MQNLLSRILLIEDEPDIQEITKSALELVGGYEVETANNGLDGIAKARIYMPDLILLDVMMPGMNGSDTLEALRKIDGLRHIPVIFMTAKVQPNEVAQYLAQGALGVISKPFDPMQLSQQVADIWGNKRA